MKQSWEKRDLRDPRAVRQYLGTRKKELLCRREPAAIFADQPNQTVESEGYCGFSEGTTRELDWNICVNLQKDYKCRGWDSNLAPAEYKSAQICLDCSLRSVDSRNEIVMLRLEE
jgi:hypothetical protein